MIEFKTEDSFNEKQFNEFTNEFNALLEKHIDGTIENPSKDGIKLSALIIFVDANNPMNTFMMAGGITNPWLQALAKLMVSNPKAKELLDKYIKQFKKGN